MSGVARSKFQSRQGTAATPRSPVFEAVALDLDGVVVDTPRFHYRAWTEALITIGLTVLPNEIYLLEGAKDRDIVDVIVKARGLYLSDEETDSLSRLKRTKFLEILKPELMPGIADFVDRLFQDGLRVALVTGTAKDAANRTLEAVGMDGVFAVVVTGDDVSRGKPSPDPYAKAIHDLGVSGRQCLAVENAPAGIRSANTAGLFCVGITSTLNSEELHEASAVFDSIPHLAAWMHGPSISDSR